MKKIWFLILFALLVSASGFAQHPNTLRADGNLVVVGVAKLDTIINPGTGNVTVNDTLLVTGSVGIGTSIPGALLDVRGDAVFNEGGIDVDFRIESDVDINTFFIEGSSGFVGIGTSSISAQLEIHGLFATSATNTVEVSNSTGTLRSFIIRDDGLSSFGTTPNSTHQVTITPLAGTSGALRITTSASGQAALLINSSFENGITSTASRSSGAPSGVRGVGSNATGIGGTFTCQGAGGSGANLDVSPGSTGSIGCNIDVRGSTSIGLTINTSGGTTDNQAMFASIATPAVNNALTTFDLNREGTGALHYTGDFFRLDEDGDNTGNIFHVVKNSATVFVIDTDGDIGIGTSAPAVPLHVLSGAASTMLRLGNNSGTLREWELVVLGAGSFRINDVNGGNTFPFIVNSGAASNALTISANGGVGVNTNSVNSVSALEVTSTTKGFRITPMTAAQASLITPVEALMVFVSSTDATFTTIGFWGYENGVWVDL